MTFLNNKISTCACENTGQHKAWCQKCLTVLRYFDAAESKNDSIFSQATLVFEILQSFCAENF